MATIRLPNEWQPRKYQRKAWAALENGVKRALLVWHRRAGKDDVCLHFAATQVYQRTGNYWHMLPEYEQARKSVWDAVNPHTGKKRIDEAFPPEIRKRTKDNEMFIEFHNGSTWQLVGSDNYNKLVGSPPVGVTASEWALANPSAWAYLSPILRENGGWAVFITTPRGKNHVHKMYEGFQGNPAWFVQKLSIEDTEALSPEEIEEARQEYIITHGDDGGEALFQQEYFCSFDAAVLGAYYAKEFQAVDRERRVTTVEYDPAVPVWTVWDIGFSDDTVIWFFQVIRGEIHIIDFYKKNGEGIDHYIDVLNKRGYRYIKIGDKPMIWLPHDARAKTFTGGKKSAQEQFQEGGYTSRIVPELSVQDGIQAARKMFPRVYFDEKKCSDGIEALRLYQREWDDDKKCFKDKPKHDWTSHAADAFRYLGVVWKELAPPEAPKPTTYAVMGKKDGRMQTATIDELWATAHSKSKRI